MAAEQTGKQLAWVAFDRIVGEAAPGGEHTNPWREKQSGGLEYRPDYHTLQRLLGVPLALGAGSQSGVPALALDVWLSYELRRAGFDEDATWPRATEPRVLPGPVARLLAALPQVERIALHRRLAAKAIPGVTGSSAKILGKNYFKQVDVVMSDWDTGPELLISTKRMDSSYGKNAANRVEESYGDAKNLRLRHPLAALGFVYALRSDVLVKAPNIAEWLIDLLQKLGKEDDAYHATCLVMLDYETSATDGAADVDAEAAEGGDDPEDEGSAPEFLAAETSSRIDSEALDLLTRLPIVTLRHDAVPPALDPARFMQIMVERILDATPVSRHREARSRRSVQGLQPGGGGGVGGGAPVAPR